MQRAPIAGLVLVGLLLQPEPDSGRAQERYPDFDLRAECPAYLEGAAGTTTAFPVQVTLGIASDGADAESGARAWSLSLQATGGAVIEEATTKGADIPPVFGAQGYEKTEITTGEGNAGAVSAVVLSLLEDAQLPLSGDFVLLHLTVTGTVPDMGCRAYGVNFVDGLVGSGQPVKNVITCGEGVTRRDDGGPHDNDSDGYEAGSLLLCAAYPFVRGNLNGDVVVDVSDSVFLLTFLFRGNEALECEQAADVNDDDTIDLSDAVFLLNHLFKSGPALEAPYPTCGFRTREGNLTCNEGPDCS